MYNKDLKIVVDFISKQNKKTRKYKVYRVISYYKKKELLRVVKSCRFKNKTKDEAENLIFKLEKHIIK